MKVKKIVEKTKEFERLEELIKEIQDAVDKLKKPIEKKSSNIATYFITNSLTLTHGIASCNEEVVNVTLGSQITALIREDLIDLLNKYLVELKAQQDALEI